MSVGYGSGGVEIIPMSIYDKLSNISCTKNGKPYREEPGYSLIKKDDNNKCIKEKNYGK